MSMPLAILLNDYNSQVESADELDKANLLPVAFGLFGEVGSILATAKKGYREKGVYSSYQRVIEEEFGDTLWYFSALCRRLGVSVDEIFARVLKDQDQNLLVAATDLDAGPIAGVPISARKPDRESALAALGESMCDLLSATKAGAKVQEQLTSFARCYLQALISTETPFARVVHSNINKVRGRFLQPVMADLPTFDSRFPAYERIPDDFEISIVERGAGRSYLEWNGVFIGDPLTDNIADKDGYRFHDVFHMAHAAILHWSPTFRALIKHKRKSDPKTDEEQDGGRAIVVEEGLTAWIFSQAKEQDFFSADKLTFDLLKGVRQFVAGYEVQQCPLRLWEMAILSGYRVFREIQRNRGGIVVANRNERSVGYKPLPGDKK
jgi:hypothetical protein